MKWITFNLFLLLRTFVGLLSFQRYFGQESNEQSPYENFLNYGEKIINPYTALENEIIQSKVDVLGEVLKKHVNKLRKSPGQVVELVFLVDSSASVGAENFFNELKFVKKLLADFTVSFNQTRVAVITFSSKTKVIRQVDHVTQASNLNHKCSLLGKELPNIKYSGGGTYTVGALREAQSVLAVSRAEAVKAVFLVTDGYSNGGDPRPAAEFLKNRGIILFTFGIHNGNVKELYDMASEPKEEHSYILDSFEEFEALARRALHEDLHDGLMISQDSSACSILCEDDKSCCDEFARCTCGAHTGHFACTCRVGYYGSGLKGHCTPCPAGTYRDIEGPSDIKGCKLCPDPNMLSSNGSISASECFCNRGYIQEGLKCVKRQCPVLKPPSNGYFVRDTCETVLNAACGIRCRTGYSLVGSSIRLCRPDGTWSGGDAKCIAKTCKLLKSPVNGEMICSSKKATIDTQCHFMCHPGYQLVGSKMRTCLPLAMWDGIKAYCKPIFCQSLPPIQNGVIKPESCTVGKLRYGARCEFGCNYGYKLSGPLKTSCADKGIWSKSSQEVRCIDVDPPSIKCPKDIFATSEPKENFALVNWDHPVAEDSSFGKVFIKTIPVTKQPMKFKIGKHKIVFLAMDEWGNRAKCDMHIYVRDDENPRIDRCESPPKFLSKEPEVEVDWEEPMFSDNSGGTLKIARTKEPGKFPQGKTVIEYTATDPSGNKQSCNITVTVQEHACDLPSDPVNGMANCTETPEAVFCSLTCKEGFAMAMKPRQDYFCAYDGIWLPESNPLPFPDCSASSVSNSITHSGEMELEGDSESACEDIFLIGQIENSIQQKLEEILIEVCSDKIICEMSEIETACEYLLEEAEEEQNSISFSRRKRHIVPNSKYSRYWSGDTHIRKYKYWKRGEPIESVIMKRRKRDTLSASNIHENKDTSNLNHTQNVTSFMAVMPNILIQFFGKGDVGIGRISSFLSTIETVSEPFEIVDFLIEFKEEFGDSKLEEFEIFLKNKMGSKKIFSDLLESRNNNLDDGLTNISANFKSESRNNNLDDKLINISALFESSFNLTDASNETLTKDNNTFNSSVDKTINLPLAGQEVSEEIIEDLQTIKRLIIIPGTNEKKNRVKKSVKVKFSVAGYGDNAPNVLQNAFSKLLHSADEGKYDFDLGEKQLKIASIRLSEDPEYLCDTGSILVDKLCVKCPVGTFFNVIMKECQQCPFGSYQPREGQVSCLVCPENTSTKGGKSKSERDCKAMCLPGSYSNDTLEPCITCTLGEYQTKYASENCTTCPYGTTTWRRGAWLMDECKAPCPEGFISETGLTPCLPCPRGYFQDKSGKTECYRCPGELLTSGANSSSLQNCIGIDENLMVEYSDLHALNFSDCLSLPCLNNGSCIPMDNGYTCECLTGYEGQNCETEINECHNDPCLNNGTCEDLIGNFQCFCQPGFEGVLCETNINDCEPNPCMNNASCVDHIDTFKCICESGYTGETCDTNIDDCAINAACSEGSTCVDKISDYQCICPSGFEGRHCTIDIDECESAPCIHGTCTNLVNDFRCTCEEGYTGKECNVNIDDCQNDPCLNNATCTDWLNGFSCTCPPAYTGKICDTLMSPHFILGFPNTGIINYAYVKKLPRQMNSITVCFWMKSSDKENYGTPFSYATEANDNAFTLTDYNGFVFSVNNEKRITDVSANDGIWHMICVVWSSSEGHWSIYKDGDEQDSGKGLSVNKNIEANGVFVIGQEQDAMGGSYSAPESFVGDMTLLNVWDEALSSTHIKKLHGECDRYDGNVKSWPDFQAGVMGQVVHKSSTFCSGCDPLSPPKFGKYTDENPFPGNEATVVCNHGYKLYSGSEKRVCLISGDWSGNEPQCRPVSCGIPNGHFRNGDISGDSYDFGDILLYSCKRGFKLIGNAKRVCRADGKWDGSKPECKVIQCSTPEPIDNGKVVSALGAYHPTNRVAFTCNSGYQMDGPSFQECGHKGNWEGSKPHCLANSCSIMPKVEHAIVTNSTKGPDAQRKLTVTCHSEYKLEGPANIVCEATGSWKQPFPKCVPKECKKPPPVQNGKYRMRVSLVGKQAKYRCNYGYELQGPSMITCKRGSWDISKWPECLPYACSDPEIPEFGIQPEPKRWAVGDILQYKCQAGYILEGNQEKICKLRFQKGYWLGETPKCEKLTCPTLSPIPGGSYKVVEDGTVENEAEIFSVYDEIELGRKRRSPYMNHHHLTFKPKEDFPQPSFSINQGFPSINGYGIQSYDKPVTSSDILNNPVILPGINYADSLTPTAPSVPRQQASGNMDYPGQPSDYDYNLGQSANAFPDVGQYTDDVEIIGQNTNVNLGDTFVFDQFPDDIDVFTQKVNPIDGQSLEFDFDYGQKADPIMIKFYYNTVVEYDCDSGYKLIGAKSLRCSENGEWSSPQPRCYEQHCPELHHLENGVITYLGSGSSSKVEFKCNEGYLLEGESFIICLNDRHWSSKVPTCKPLSCENPAEPQNGTAIYSSMLFGSIATYECDSGFVLEGSIKRHCGNDGFWNGSLPRCVGIVCKTPSVIENGFIYYEGSLNVGSTVEYGCNDCFKLVGTDIRQCQMDESWSLNEPNCEKITCPNVTSIENGKVVGTDNSCGSLVEYECDPGYEMQGVNQAQCLDEERWSTSAPTCEKISCGSPPEVSNANFTGDSFMFSDKVTYHCEPGYIQSGDSTLICSDKKHWKGIIPHCSIVNCTKPKGPSNGRVRVNGLFYGATVMIVCDPGFKLVGEGSLMCDLNGEWDKDMPFCAPVICPAAPKPKHSSYNSTELYFESFTSLKYECHKGYYTYSDNTHLRCNHEGSWEGDIIKCNPVDCGKPKVFENGFVDGNIYTLGYVIDFTCYTGFKLIGEKKATCQENGKWSVIPKCTKIICREPDNIPFGRLSVYEEQHDFNSSLEYQCDEGYVLSGPRTIKCGLNGEWSNEGLTKCSPILCPKPPEDMNAIIIGSIYEFNHTLTYKCHNGYKIKGRAVLTCQSDGSWCSEFPVCELITCENPVDIKNGYWNIKSRIDIPILSEAMTKKVPSAKGYRKSSRKTSRKTSSKTSRKFSQPSKLTSLLQSQEEEVNYRLGHIIEYNCNKGYFKTSSGISECTDDGWTSPPPTCSPVTCVEPMEVTNGKVLGDDYKFGSAITYICNEGFQLFGVSTRKCQADKLWTDAEPYCRRKECPRPSKLANGEVYVQSIQYQAVISYVCEPGFKLIGPSTRICQSDENWSGSQPFCLEILCEDPPKIPYALIDVSELKVGSKAQYTCIEGYRMDSSTSIINCQSNGKWDRNSPKCLRIDCGKLDAFPHGSVSTFSTVFATKVTFSCERGYKLSGSEWTHCQENGKWSHDTPICERITCKQLAKPLHGSIVEIEGPENSNDQYSFIEKGRQANYDKILDSVSKWADKLKWWKDRYTKEVYYVDENITFTCDPGWEIVGTSNLTCKDDGKWSSLAPQCQKINCGKPNVPKYSYHTAREYQFGDKITLICAKGYLLKGNPVLECMKDGTWFSENPSCEPVNCGPPSYVPNSHVSYTLADHGLSHYYGSITKYSCREGYVLEGSVYLTCESSGQWVGPRETPVCKEMPCTDPPILPNGKVRQTVNPQRAVYNCDLGYELSGRSTVYCNLGRWKGFNTSCNPVTCKEPPIPENANMTANHFAFRGQVNYSCIDGYEIHGKASIECGVNGKWVGDIPKCLKIDCGPPKEISFGHVYFNGTRFEDSALYECEDGFKLLGSETLICFANRTWSGQLAECRKISCGLISPPENGYVISVGEHFGDEAVFSCDKGFALVGEQNSVCQANGTWSNLKPTCEGVKCRIPPVPPNAKQSSSQIQNSAFVYGDKISYNCLEGYFARGDLSTECQKTGDWSRTKGKCSKISCGRPKVNQKGVVIVGRSFYFGDSVKVLCPGGTQTSGSGALTCLEDGTWSGVAFCRGRCSRECLNGGLCLGRNICSCQPGYTGRSCQKAVCVLPCLNGGICSAPNECQCKSGYDGKRCQSPVCENNCGIYGKCIGPNFCLCQNGQTGSSCPEYLDYEDFDEPSITEYEDWDLAGFKKAKLQVY